MTVLMTLEQSVQSLTDTVLGSEGLQGRLAVVERTIRNGSVVGTVSWYFWIFSRLSHV